MPPTKVCSQCKAPVRRKTCERYAVFRSKAECNLQEKALKRMRAVESDSVKSARKAKDKLHKPFKECQELVSELYTGRNKTEYGWQVYMRESRDSDQFLVNTQVQSHALLRRGFGTSVPFIFIVSKYIHVNCLSCVVLTRGTTAGCRRGVCPCSSRL